MRRIVGQSLGVQVRPACDAEHPPVLDLPAQVQVQVSHQQSGLVSRESGGPRRIRCCDVRRPVEVAEGLVGRLPVAGRELIRKFLCADPVDAHGVVRVGDRCVARLNGPHRLGQGADGGRRVEDNLSAVETEDVPVERVVAPVADVDGNLPEGCLEHGVARVALAVVRRFVEVAHTRDVVLPVLSDVVAVVADHHGRVPNHSAVLQVAFEDRRHNHHVVLLREARDEVERRTSLRALSQLRPRVLLTRAEEEGACPGLLQAENVHVHQPGGVDDRLQPCLEGIVLFLDGHSSRQHNRVLNRRDTHPARRPQLLLRAVELVGAHFKVVLGSLPLHLFRDGQFRRLCALQHCANLVELGRGKVLPQRVLDIRNVQTGSHWACSQKYVNEVQIL
eukprot:Rhum_TRINITY_DN17235_c0_g1::Rhum_TRINITY_DN17235_c0_g1_i1::g.165477::m.165477